MNSTAELLNNTVVVPQTSGGCLWVEGDLSKVDAFLFIAISIIAIFGNIIVFVCYARYRILRNVTNVFIVSLSASDLIVACISIPFSYSVFVCGVTPRLDQGRIEDLVYNICDMVPSIWSIYSLALVAIDRALAIKKPFIHRTYVTRRTAWMAVAGTWILALFFVSLLFFIERTNFTIFIILVAYALPVTIMIVCYTVMGYVAKTHAKELSSLERTATRLRNESNASLMTSNGVFPPNGQRYERNSIKSQTSCVSSPHPDVCENWGGRKHPREWRTSNIFRRSLRRLSSNISHSRLLKRELKAAMTLALILGCFIISWTPFIAINIEYFRCPECPLNHYMVKYFKILHYTNSALNPILYIVLNRRWRGAFKSIILCEAKHTYRSESSSELFGW